MNVCWCRGEAINNKKYAECRKNHDQAGLAVLLQVGRNAPLQLRYLIGDILQLRHYAIVQDTLF